MSPRTLSWWRWSLGRGSGGRRGNAPAFIEVLPHAGSGGVAPPSSAIEVVLPSGVRVLVPSGVTAADLRLVLSTLEAR